MNCIKKDYHSNLHIIWSKEKKETWAIIWFHIIFYLERVEAGEGGSVLAAASDAFDAGTKIYYRK